MPQITLLPKIIIERKAKFQLQVSKNNAVIFSPSKFMDPPEVYPRTPWGSVDARLRTAELHYVEGVRRKLYL
jgi:hypothetical protein